MAAIWSFAIRWKPLEHQSLRRMKKLLRWTLRLLQPLSRLSLQKMSQHLKRLWS